MKLEHYISKKYFSVKRKGSFASLITTVSVIGITIGVAALVIIMSVMNGFEKEVRERILAITGHLSLRPMRSLYIAEYDSLQKEINKKLVEEISGYSPVISNKAGISYNGIQDGILIKGVIPALEINVGEWSKHIIEGSYSLTDTLSKEGKLRPAIILGKYVAERLGVLVGDEVILIAFPNKTSGSIMPRLKKFVVRGIFETGLYDFDASIGYINLQTAYSLFDVPKNSVNYIQYKLKDYNLAGVLADSLSKWGEPFYYGLDWETENKTLFKWMKLEKIAMFLALSLIIMVAAFNIVSSLTMLVMEKTKDIGVLRTLGFSKKHIERIFILNGMYIAFLGVVIGTIIGLLFSYGQQHYEWINIPGDVYFINKLPIKVKFLDVLAVDVVSILLVFLASYYPAKKASNLDIVEAIHYG